MHNDKLGHNKPPKTIDELIHNGRIELKNSVIKKLKEKLMIKENTLRQSTTTQKGLD